MVIILIEQEISYLCTGIFDNVLPEIADILPENQISPKLRYIERLLKKSNNGDFSNFTCNEINNLQASNSQI